VVHIAYSNVWLKDPDLKSYSYRRTLEWRFNYCKCCQVTVRNAKNPCYSRSDILIPTDTNVH